MDIDARGPRFGAAVTAVVLAVVLITGNVWLLAWQTLAFALGAAGGVQRSPYGWAFRTAVRPRLGPPRAFEAPQPPRFAQAVGLAFAGLGLAGYTLGPHWLGMAATAAALAAAFLNAVFAYCLGCEMYLLVRRAAVRA
ncbi:DUF4395 domain-containing protein [Streptomyces sp. NPDC049915]|uniref:DUF4395 domain-containing protein n=1 Tax=Streptomyces sp. NPDC049915 TaxID=3155510 RepID=UPI003437D0F1